jgi:hypothetical protein
VAEPAIQGIALALALAAAATLAAAAGATLTLWAGFFRTHLLVVAYVAVLLTFAQSTVGAKEVFVPIYNRGTGVLFFSWLLWMLLALSALALVRDQLLGKATAPCSLRPWIAGFALLFLGQSAVGIALGLGARASMDALGLLNIAAMGMLTLLLLRTIDSRKALDFLVTCALALIAARQLFGIARYLFFGGDPVNPYDNIYDARGAKLVFFDINDSLLACMAGAYYAFRLLHEPRELGQARKWLFAGLILLGAGVVVFSLRRTGWGGMALVCALLVWLAPRGKRAALGTLIGIVLCAGLFVLYFDRLAISWDRADVGMGAFYSDLVRGKNYGQSSLRALELELAWQAFLDSPIFGQGAWGRFAAYSGFGREWHGGEAAFGYVHSAVLHILFKAGLIGFALFCGLVVAFLRFVKRSYRLVEPRYRAVLVMGAAGLLFLLPDFLFGTPLVELRTTQLIGLCLALPYVAYNVSARAGARLPWASSLAPATR